MCMHAHGSGQSQRVLSLLYNLYYTFYLVLGYEQLRPTVSQKGRRCTDQFPQQLCEVPEIQYFDWWGEMVRNFHDLQATPVSTRWWESETSWQLEAACTGLRQHYAQWTQLCTFTNFIIWQTRRNLGPNPTFRTDKIARDHVSLALMMMNIPNHEMIMVQHRNLKLIQGIWNGFKWAGKYSSPLRQWEMEGRTRLPHECL